MNINDYNQLRAGGTGFYRQKRGLIEVHGKEAVQFLNGLITNDVAKLEDGAQMSAAFPNAQGRLLAVVRVMRKDDRFLFETEEATHEKVYNNLFRFTFAGDFFVEDLSENYGFFRILNLKSEISDPELIKFETTGGADYFVPPASVEAFKAALKEAVEISDELYEVLRIENGVPLYGVDMDETTIVPEIGLPDVISYTKGCYIGQEIIARIYFRGHIAKQLKGLIFDDENVPIQPNDELKTPEGKNAGRLASLTFSPKLQKTIALAYVRYDYLADGTELKVNDLTVKVKDLPFA